jgi:hypothetical protein
MARVAVFMIENQGKSDAPGDPRIIRASVVNPE